MEKARVIYGLTPAEMFREGSGTIGMILKGDLERETWDARACHAEESLEKDGNDPETFQKGQKLRKGQSMNYHDMRYKMKWDPDLVSSPLTCPAKQQSMYTHQRRRGHQKPGNAASPMHLGC